MRALRAASTHPSGASQVMQPLVLDSVEPLIDYPRSRRMRGDADDYDSHRGRRGRVIGSESVIPGRSSGRIGAPGRVSAKR